MGRKNLGVFVLCAYCVVAVVVVVCDVVVCGVYCGGVWCVVVMVTGHPTSSAQLLSSHDHRFTLRSYHFW